MTAANRPPSDANREDPSASVPGEPRPMAGEMVAVEASGRDAEHSAPPLPLRPSAYGSPAEGGDAADSSAASTDMIIAPTQDDDWNWPSLRPPLPMRPSNYPLVDSRKPLSIEPIVPRLPTKPTTGPVVPVLAAETASATSLATPVEAALRSSEPKALRSTPAVLPSSISEEIASPAVAAIAAEADNETETSAATTVPPPTQSPQSKQPTMPPLSAGAADRIAVSSPASPKSQTVAVPDSQRATWGEVIARGVKYALVFAGAALATILTLMVLYRFINPPFSSLMVQQRLTGQEVTQTWVPLESISDDVVRAVLLSEDGRFCQHSGVDFEEMQNAIERAGDGGVPRGASTISMQVIKNLFLWPSKSYVRKAIEIPLTYAMETLWPKRRIMEIYLNIAEWGPGIFGVEAASQFHFNKPAAALNEREAARLAVALPNPFMRDAGDPGPRTRRLASDIQARMRAAYASQTACVTIARRSVTRPASSASQSKRPARETAPDDEPSWSPNVQWD